MLACAFPRFAGTQKIILLIPLIITIVLLLTLVGETKTWYGIPSRDADKFDALMKKMHPDLFKVSPDLLFHITTMLSPKKLVENGIKVVGLNQRPGDIVITFPRAYHAGFNHGFNLAEAVNFAPSDWLPYGQVCSDMYRLYGKQPVFALDELLVEAVRSGSRDRYTRQAFDDMIRREQVQLSEVFQSLPGLTSAYCSDTNAHQCAKCSSMSFLSWLACRECEHCYCLACPEPCHSTVLQVRYSVHELIEMRPV